MDFEIDSKIPIYVQIIDFMKKRIIVGEIKGGDRLPSVREYASEMKVNPNTIQRVYTELENQQLIYTQRGIGKFVTEDENVINEVKIDIFNETIDRFIKDSRELGFTKDEIVSIISKRFGEG
ncbi:GntR family transcriptional regulator [Clostridium paraputrificum]|uniref:GntR family transcriptional regulator n=1 Tax=Clostridium TaxID=1485 RepID=UPI003D33FA9C